MRVCLQLITIGLVAGSGAAQAQQRLQPLPPPPVSLTVPHPIPPMSTSSTAPRDLYQQPTPPQSVPPIVIYPPGYVHGLSVYVPGYGYMPPTETPPQRMAPQPVPRGALWFDTVPGAAQVYVDDYYAGVIDDFGMSGRPLDLEAGPHRIELRAPGYATLAFNVKIVANQTTRYRGDLQRLASSPATTATAATPRTMYVIPNCYAGDRPPSRPLPRGCDIAQLRIRTEHW